MKTSDRRLSFLGLRPHGDLADLTCYTSRHRDIVWFVKSPPLVPPSLAQRLQRLRFKCAAIAWKALHPDQRDAWNTAARRASLRIHGYDLWIFWQLRRDRNVIITLQNQTGRQLL